MAGSVAPVTINHRSRGVVRTAIHLLCDASGVATAAVVGVGFGKLVGVIYAPGTLDTGADITISDADSGKALVTLTNAGTSNLYFRPTANITTNTGAAGAVTAATTAPNVNRDIYLGGKVKVAVAAGGNLGEGDLVLIVDEANIDGQ